MEAVTRQHVRVLADSSCLPHACEVAWNFVWTSPQRRSRSPSLLHANLTFRPISQHPLLHLKRPASTMAPKVNCQPAKLAQIVTYMQKSKVCHSIKDLEKHLPSVASINGMQVKDYVQTLQDESKITCEKIGSGNWYWSFASQAKNEKTKALSEAQANHDKAAAVVTDLRAKLAEASAANADEEESEYSREELMAQKAVLEADIKALQKELASYSDSDPTELEKRRKETREWFAKVEQYTDDIQSMEGWMANAHGRESVHALQHEFYGDEYDAEEEALREIVL